MKIAKKLYKIIEDFLYEKYPHLTKHMKKK
jgi:hypothetical protein